MRVLHTLRLFKISLGIVWSIGCLVFGFWLWQRGLQPIIGNLDILSGSQRQLSTLISIWIIAGGEFVLMWLVADDICPKASANVASFLKLTAGCLFWIAAASGIWLFVSGL